MSLPAQELKLNDKDYFHYEKILKNKPIQKISRQTQNSVQYAKTIYVTDAGSLNDLLTKQEKQSITELVLTGNLNALDFVVLRDSMPLLETLDLKAVQIQEYNGNAGTFPTFRSYNVNQLPALAFCHPSGEVTNTTLRAITLPDSATAIDDGAFIYCHALESIHISERILLIGMNAFTHCKALITVDENNPNFSSEDGLLFNKNKQLLIQCPVFKSGDYTVPSTVDSIGLFSFFQCNNLNSVTIPNSVVAIEGFAFNGCMGLSSLTLNNRPENIKLGDDVFDINAVKICDLYVPLGTKTLYQSTEPWRNFKSITENSEGFFVDISELTLPEGNVAREISVTSTVAWSVSCDKDWISFSKTSGTGNDQLTITALENNAAGIRTAVISFSTSTYGAHIINVKQFGAPVTITLTPGNLSNSFTSEEIKTISNLKIKGSIDARDFKTMMSGMPTLSSLDMSEAVITAYQGNNGTMSYDYSYPANEIPEQTFYYSSIGGEPNQTLMHVLLPETTLSVGRNTFGSCTALEEILIPDKVHTIRTNAFSSCQKLSKLTLGVGVKSLEYYSFNYCIGLDSVIVKSGSPVNLIYAYGVFDGVNKTSCILYVPFGTKLLYETAIGWKDFTNIVENPYGFIIETDTVMANTYNSHRESIGVRANCQWKAVSDQSWLHVVTETGNGNDSLKLVLDANPSAFSRTAHITVSANGVYSQTIAVIQAAFPKIIQLTTAGSLSTVLTTEELNGITHLVLAGDIDSRDFKTMRDSMPKLALVDLSKAVIRAYTGNGGTFYYNNANTVPQYAFCSNYDYKGKADLLSVIIPSSATTIGNSAFARCEQLETVIIPNSVSKIEMSAFDNCTALKEIVIPSSMTKIESTTFRNCIKLRKLIIPVTINIIDYSAFESCSGIDSLYIPNSVTQISDNAFGNCTGLVYVRLSDSLDKIEGQTFYNCTGLKSIEIPDLTASIGYNSFYGCKSLSSVNIGKSISYIEYGAFESCTSLEKIIIPSNVTFLGHNVFKNCTALTDITLSDSLVEIGFETFGGCSSLTEINIPESIQEIVSQMFKNCIALTNVNLGNSVHTIGSGAFANCKNLEFITLPNSVKIIGNDAFANCSVLNEIVLGNSLNTIGDNAFRSCTALESIEFPSSLKKIDYNAFESCTALSNVKIPDSVTFIGEAAFLGCTSLDSISLSNTLVAIAHYTFNGCKKLKKVTPGNSVTSIGSLAFAECASLAEIILPSSLNKIGSSAFSQCISLSKLSIPNSVVSIEPFAFMSCPGLTEVTLSNSLTEIESSVFYHCSGLKNIKIPNSVKIIGYNAFEGCVSLAEVTMGSFVTTIQPLAFKDCNSLKHVSIPGKVTKIGNEAFNGCTGLLSITAYPLMPVDLNTTSLVFGEVDKTNCVLRVPQNKKFAYGTANVWKDFANIIENPFGLLLDVDSVNLPVHKDSQTTIHISTNTTWTVSSTIAWLNVSPESGTGNANLTLIADANSMMAPRSGMISVHADGLESQHVKVTQDAATKVISISAGNLYASLTAEELKTITRLKISGTVDARDIKTMRDSMPGLTYLDMSATSISAYEGNGGTEGSYNRAYPVNAVPQYAFYNGYEGKTTLKSILLPPTMTSIGQRAFTSCAGIDSLIIPDPVNTIADYAFENCRNLKYVKLPASLTTIGRIFDNCQHLTKVDIPASVTSIGSGAFGSCILLDNVVLGNSVKSIGTWAFYNCQGLKNITWSNSITSIDNEAFTSCKGLSRVMLPKTLKTIGRSVFSMCSSLKTVSIPASVTSIGSYAFSTSSLDTIFALSPNPVSLSSDGVFSSVNKTTCKLFVPKGAKELYQNAVQWRDFMNILDDKGFSLSHDSVWISSEGEATFTIATNENWTVKSDQPWLTISPKNGTGDATLTISGEVNPNYGNRTATITVSVFEAPDQTIVVIQSGTPKTVQISSGELMTVLSSEELNTVSHLVIKGTIDVRDFKTMRDFMPQLAYVDLSNASITGYSGEAVMEPMVTSYPANEIPAFAFYKPYLTTGKQTLTTVIFPPDIIAIGNSAFKYASNLNKIIVPDNVKIIGSNAFAFCKRMEEVVLGNSMQTISESAFKYCSGMKNISLGNSLEIIGTQSFYYCSELKSILLPSSLRSIAHQSFLGCEKLDSLIIPNSVTVLGSDAFRWCYSLKRVKLPDTISKLAGGLFDFCTALSEINLPSTITSIDTDIFYACYSLREIQIPESVTFIGSRAFGKCTSLTSISIPAAVTRIDFGAFEFCTGLTDIYAYPTNAVDLSASYYATVFNNVNKTTCRLHVPTGSKASYASAVEWKDFTTILEMNTGLTDNIENQNLIYPNPVKDFFRIRQLNEPADIFIYDTTGNLRLNKQISGNESVQINHLPSGVYIIRLICRDQITKSLLIKE